MQHFSSLERNILFHTLCQVLLRVLRVLAICRNWPQVWLVRNNYDVLVLPNWVSCLLPIWSFFQSRISLARSISQQNWHISFVLRVGLTKLNHPESLNCDKTCFGLIVCFFSFSLNNSCRSFDNNVPVDPFMSNTQVNHDSLFLFDYIIFNSLGTITVMCVALKPPYSFFVQINLVLTTWEIIL